jgi:IS5 family transposase
MPRVASSHRRRDDRQDARRRVIANLIRKDDTALYGDKGYASDEKKRAAEGAGVLWAEKAKSGRKLTQCQRPRNRPFVKVRAKVAHVFRVLKCQFGYRKSATAASPRTTRRCSHSSRSPSISYAADLRPLEGTGPKGPCPTTTSRQTVAHIPPR